jgi:hypothetical protein
MQDVTFDVECYTNYFLAKFKNHETGKIVSIQALDDQKLDRKKLLKVMQSYRTITFNGLNYDLPMISAALAGYSLANLKKLSDEIINEGQPSWVTYRKHDLRDYGFNHIDIKEPSAGVMVSLKLYGGRLGAPKLQDLPIEPSQILSEQDAIDIDKYCENDLDTTWMLYKAQQSQFNLRAQMSEQYSVNLMSKSDAQVAEAVFRHELERQKVRVNKVKLKSDYSFKFNCPSWIQFKSKELNDVLELVKSCEFKLSAAMQPLLPKEINKAFEFNESKYKFGIGGLHSQETKQICKADDDHELFDIDAASFYPFIILGQGLYPKHLTPKFLTVYKSIVDRRIEAKRNGDKTTADSLKITINGSYGKFGSQYSFLFSPDLLIQTTLTGQLCLLMLIEQVESAGAKVMSANTDGIVVYANKKLISDVTAAYSLWELETGFELEQTNYSALYSRDVNNYIAVKPNGEIKGKGVFAETSLMKNPSTPICYEAVKQFLAKGTPITDTIRACTDVTQFLAVRTVKGGALWRGEYLGKTVRWYYSTDNATIHYKTNGNKVPKSDGAKPLMDLTDTLPSDLDVQWYFNECKSILETLGLC